MLRGHSFRCAFLLTAALALATGAPVTPQVKSDAPAAKPVSPPVKAPPPDQAGPAAGKARLQSVPGLEPVARTRLLMLAINWPNFQGLDQKLRQRPGDADTWNTVRDHALLIAENGNLLMLRPPRDGSEESWLERARALRATATRLARTAAARDHARSREGLIDLAKTCNNCHRSFQVDVHITAFGESSEANVPAPPPVPTAPAPPRVPPPPAPPAPPAPPGGS